MAKKKYIIYTEDFFAQSSFFVAEHILGAYLVRRNGDHVIERMITEVEIYDGLDDRASHASRGITLRNKIMFGDPGYWYVYLIYGMYSMLNIVTREAGYPAALLIRGVEGASVPGKLTQLYNITRDFNGIRADLKCGLWIEEKGIKRTRYAIERGPRIGIDYAGEMWAQKPYRLCLRKRV